MPEPPPGDQRLAVEKGEAVEDAHWRSMRFVRCRYRADGVSLIPECFSTPFVIPNNTQARLVGDGQEALLVE